MKIRQHISNSLDKDTTDKLIDKKIIYETRHIKESIQEYFSINTACFIYPAKSYIVATCYSCWLVNLAKKEDVKISHFDLLNDESFLYNNDPYFSVYKSSEALYNYIFDYIKKNNIGLESKIVSEIFEYFVKEYRLTDNERTYLANNALLQV
jgi:hypothetical protein